MNAIADTRTAPWPRQGLAWLGFVALCFGAGLLGSLFGNTEFYRELVRPSWAPPGWLFGPVWSALYLAMGTAAWLVWRQERGTLRRRALVVFGVQLALNAAWTPVFFGLEQIVAALVVLLANVAAVVAMLTAFSRCSRLAGWLVAPLLAWVCFAAALNAAIVALN